MTISGAFIKIGKGCVLAGLLLLKLPLQLAGCLKRPEIFIDSVAGYRFPVYLALALVSEFQIEIRTHDLLFFHRYLSFQDFFFRTVLVLPNRNPVSPVVLGRQGAHLFPSRQMISIDEDYYSPPKKAASLVMPYFAHPEFYRERLDLMAPAFRPGPRRLRIFFCGTVAKEAYSRAFHFPILNRNEIIDYISTRFADHIGTSLQGVSKPITLVTTSDRRDTLEKHSLSTAAYFQALCVADFFIAPPGWRMPHSHNIIEAMTAGAIPITNYGHFFDPPLQDGIDCLAFTSLEDLDRALRVAMNLSANQVDGLRRGTFDYYQRYLKPSAFGANFRRNLSPSMKLLVNGESLLP